MKHKCGAQGEGVQLKLSGISLLKAHPTELKELCILSLALEDPLNFRVLQDQKLLNELA